VNNVQFISGVLGIKDPIHRQKIAVKAMDVVLFGSPKDSSNYVKDVTLITLLVLALAGALYTYKSNRHSKQHLNKLMEHMEILSSAEKELQELQVSYKMVLVRAMLLFIFVFFFRSSYNTPVRNKT
jgi:stromal interaction molecule 1